MTEHEFGPVKVLEGEGKEKPAATIRFPSQVFTVTEAEGFMCNLIDGITKAREIEGDPI